MKSSLLFFSLLLNVSLLWGQTSHVAIATPTIFHAPKQVDELTLGISNKTAAPGTEVTVDVYNQNPANIISMQYSMKWDTKVLKFKALKGFGLPSMSKDNFGKHIIDNGQITLSWYDENLRGLSIPAGRVLYQIVFEVIGTSGDKGFINFVDYPTPIEIGNPKGNIIDLNAGTGKITVK